MTRPRIFTTHRHRYSEDFWKLAGNMRWHFDYDEMSVHDEKFDGDVPPEHLERTIVSRIQQCNLFIAVGRRATGNSGWCLWEVQHARDMGKPILSYSPHGIAAAAAPALVRSAPTYCGHFTQVRRLVGVMAALGLDV